MRIVAVLLIWVIPVTIVRFYNYSREILTLYDNSSATLNMRRQSSAISPDISSDITNYTEFWQEVHAQEYDDYLYHRNFDVDRVLKALRQSTVLAADFFKKQTSFKFKLTLEGSQTAIFKVRLM